MNIAEAIRDARKNQGLTQEKLAEISGVSRVTIARIERGSAGSRATLDKLMKVLHIELVEKQKSTTPTARIGNSR